MTELRILPIGTPSLRQRALPITDFDEESLRRNARGLLSTLDRFQQRRGFCRAIAAPQVGFQQRMIALRIVGWPSVILNPEIVWKDIATMTLWDDCMCFPDLLVRVSRAQSISVRFIVPGGGVEERGCLTPSEAELLQHEIDHLDGILAFDRAVGFEPIVSRSAFEADPDHFSSTVDLIPSKGP